MAETFQSTPPVKAATSTMVLSLTTREISIHAAREGGDEWTADDTGVTKISIHAAREGGDVPVQAGAKIELNFNPRRP